MGKATKKKKEKAADFSKKKLKLGKGKQLASNAVDTSFKARSIALPSQSILESKSEDTPLTRRRLSLDDLITQLKHYNSGTRKDALLGMRELLSSNLHLIELHLVLIVTACTRAIADEDAGVRKGLLAFFAWLLPIIPPDNLAAHSSVLLLFASSAQTHIFPEIRIDATRLITLLLDYIPDAVVAGWSSKHEGHGARILQGYLGILNGGTRFGETDGPMQATSTASVTLSAGSKLVLLQSLSTFLRHAVDQQSSTSRTATQDINPASMPLPSWYLKRSFTSETAYEAFVSILHPPCIFIRDCISEDVTKDDFLLQCPLVEEDYAFSIADLSDLSPEEMELDSTGESQAAFTAQLSKTLFPTLRSIFLDYAPTVFSPSSRPSEPDTSLVMAVASIAQTLYGSLLRDSSHRDNYEEATDNLRALLGYMTPYFPFTANGTRDVKVEQTFQELSLTYCELCALVTMVTHSEQTQRRSHKRARQEYRPKSEQLRAAHDSSMVQVRSYISQLLRGEATRHGQIGAPLSASAYIALLPTVWVLSSSSSTGDDVFASLVEHAVRTSSKSAAKRPAVELIAQLVLLEKASEYHGPFRIPATSKQTGPIEEWLTSLPQTLWELGNQNVALTELILRFLLRTFQQSSSMLSPKVVATLQSRLPAFFSILHPTRGVIAGPFSKLSSPSKPSARRLALDLVFTMARLPTRRKQKGQTPLPAEATSLIQAVDRAIPGLEEEGYWSEIKARI